MKKNIFFLLLLFASIIFAQNFEKTLVGKWHGKGKIIVTWCERDSLNFDINIAKDGKVTGKIGDAEIKNAVLEKRSPVMEALGNGEYIIRGELEGAIVKDEKISREGFTLMFDYENGKLAGGFHTTGSKFGGKEKMVLTVSGVKLEKEK